MIVLPLSAGSSTGVRDALLARGWEGELADLSGGGMERAVFVADQVPDATIEAMVPLAGRLGLDLVTGPDWLLLSGPRSRLGAFARPWLQPEAVQQLAVAVGMRLPAEAARIWRCRSREIPLDRPVIVGVINATPDSFSPASRAGSIEEAAAAAERLIVGGATMLEVGGESTRPGADVVGADQELSRVGPMIEALVQRFPDIPLIVDTVRSSTAAAALELGVVAVNDVTAGRHDPALTGTAARARAGLILSHSRGGPGSIASDSHIREGEDIVTAVAGELCLAADDAISAGCGADTLVIDPGFGFGKSPAQNFALLRGIDALVATGYPVMAALSRKRFLGNATGREVDDRDRATAAASALAYAGGARLFRVHDAAAVRDALAVAAAMEEG